MLVSNITGEQYVLLLMLVIGSSFAHRDDVWMWSSNPLILKFGQIWEIFASFPGCFVQFFYFIKYVAECDPDGVWMLSRNFVPVQGIKGCPALGLFTKSTELSSFTLSYCVILYRCSEVRANPQSVVV